MHLQQHKRLYLCIPVRSGRPLPFLFACGAWAALSAKAVFFPSLLLAPNSTCQAPGWNMRAMTASSRLTVIGSLTSQCVKS